MLLLASHLSVEMMATLRISEVAIHVRTQCALLCGSKQENTVKGEEAN
jgi:hypothetical protein